MQLNNFSKAFGSLVTRETTDLKINDNLTLQIIQVGGGNRQYTRRNAEFGRNNPEHSLVKKFDEWAHNVITRTITPDIIEHLCQVVIVDWTLVDDNGKEYPFSVDMCRDLLTQPHGIGESVATRVLDAATDSAQFQADWESIVVKNSQTG